jgi:hypothetical protein
MQSRQADKAAWQGRPRLRTLVLGVAIIAAACSNGGGSLNQGAGGGSASGGSDGSGGTPSSGGGPGTGGGTATAGSVGTGGQTATGGAVGSGGQSTKGGASGTGGALGSGGTPGSGGAAAAGGQQASGGRGTGGAAVGTGGAGGSAGGAGGMAGAKSGGPSAPCDTTKRPVRRVQLRIARYAPSMPRTAGPFIRSVARRTTPPRTFLSSPPEGSPTHPFKTRSVPARPAPSRSSTTSHRTVTTFESRGSRIGCRREANQPLPPPPRSRWAVIMSTASRSRLDPILPIERAPRCRELLRSPAVRRP